MEVTQTIAWAKETARWNHDLEKIYLDGNNGRQILRVTFGSVLTQPLFHEEETYTEVLTRHLGKHIRLLMETPIR